jgi:hypothetical protein
MSVLRALPLLPRRGAPFGCGDRRPPDIEVSCKYIAKTVRDEEWFFCMGWAEG